MSALPSIVRNLVRAVFFGKFQIVWNSTSLDAFKACPRRYQYAILEGWTSSAQNIDITFGLAFHSAIEHYHFALAAGADHQVATIAAVRRALEATWPDTILSTDTKKSRPNLIRTVVWYLDAVAKDDSIKTLILDSGKPAVEVTFAMGLDIPSPSGESYMLAGHIDRIGYYIDRLKFVDLKTTGGQIDSNYFSYFNPHNQMSCYNAAGDVIAPEPIEGGIIDAAQVLVNGSRFGRGFVHRTKGQMAEWRHDLRINLSLAESYARANYWPMNDTACRLCAFRGVCATDPGVRDKFLESGFIRRTINPLEART